MKLSKDLTTGAIAIVLLTVALGVAYPLAITAISQVAFGDKANGSLIKKGGTVVGSRLIGVSQTIDTGKKDAGGNPITRPDPAYFQPRPSATGYSGSATFFANRGPNSSAARFFYRDALAAYLAFEGPFNPGLTNAKVPVDAVTASASGVDPDISQANAAIQARRVAATRNLPLPRVMALIGDSTDGRFLGVIGEPGVNIPELNVALDMQGAR
ncbi:MAG: potassium-transporting ATPase KdpC subunit [Solirubrobacteraceae bacterium]|jgi:K+-transporting ATPase ATPase C chain|nr:potassium-transporting ATPase KdpC subunit [Solirubrobacteraceae bacterium]